jgi:cell division control protein 6
MGLFREKSALELDRLSVEVVSRGEEAGRLRKILDGVESGFLPKVIGVHGPPGSGKTLVSRRVCEEFEKNSGGRFRFVYVNLGEVRTVFSCANRLVRALGGSWRSGRYGLDGVMEEFWRNVLDWHGEGRRFLLLCLDEADHLFIDRRGDPSGFLYRLVRSQDRLEGSGISLSLLTISNSPLFEIWDLDARVRSSMGFEEIFFKPYSKEELKGILTNRCSEAFNPGVVDPAVIDACVSYTAEQSRDVRRMIDLLRFCGEVAEAGNAAAVSMEHYYQAVKRVEADHYTTLFHGLADLQLELLHHLAFLAEIDGVSAPSTNQLYDQYKKATGKDTRSYRALAGVLKELEVMNLVGAKTVSKGRGGRSNEVWLKIPAEAVLDYTRPDWRDIKKRVTEAKKIMERLERLSRRRRLGY